MKKITYIILIFIIIVSCEKKANLKEHIKNPEPYEQFDKITGKLQSGQSLFSALLGKNINRVEAYNITRKLNEKFDLRYCHPEDSFAVRIDSLGKIHQLCYYPNKIKTYIVTRDTTETFSVCIDTLKLQRRIEHISGKLSETLYQSMIESGATADLVMRYSDIFQWDIDFFIDPRQGDEFALVFEAYYHNDKFIYNGNILGAVYKNQHYDFTAYYYNNNNNIDGYFDRDGKSFQKTFLKSPLNYSYISSYFSKARYHPILKIVRPHNGVDYAARYGTPVVASADGTVIYRGWKGGYGKTIKIRHKNGRYVTLYGHLSRYAKGIRKGVKVKQKQVIGYVGSTGLSTGPHLHYTIYYNGVAINPLKLKNVSGPPIPKSEMENFYKAVKDMDKYLNEYLLKITKLSKRLNANRSLT